MNDEQKIAFLLGVLMDTWTKGGMTVEDIKKQWPEIYKWVEDIYEKSK